MTNNVIQRHVELLAVYERLQCLDLLNKERAQLARVRAYYQRPAVPVQLTIDFGI